MKIYLNLFILLIAISIFSCTNSLEDISCLQENCGQITFYATHETKDDSKTSLDDNKIYWSAHEEINMFFESSSEKFTSTNTAKSLSASFTGNLPEFSGNTVMGLYPYNVDATCTDGTIYTTFSNNQTAVANSFAEGVFPSISKSVLPNVNMTFYNICGGIKFNVVNSGITKVTLTGNNSEILAGDIQVNFAGDSPVVSNVSNGNDSITLTSESGLNVDSYYYIVSLPRTFPGGLKLRFDKFDMYAERTINSPLEIQRSVWGVIGNADKDLSWINKVPNNEIWYTSSDGNIVTPYNVNAFGSVTIDSNTYSNGKGVIYFSGDVTSVGSNAFNSQPLISVYLPNTVTSIGYRSFLSCTNLVEVRMQNSVSSISTYAFYGCSSLKYINLSNSLTEIKKYTFSNCSALQSITIPSSVTSLGMYAFSGCSGLTAITIPNQVKSIDSYAFSDCSSLVSISLPSNAEFTSIGNCTFRNCVKLLTVEIPATITTIGEEAFSGCTKLTDVTCKATIPPTADNKFLYNNSSLAHIYVPSATVEAYKAADGWKAFASIIFAEP